ncbi:gamma-interferon-inducible lysosomal thiol reductase-like [Acanthaster planci]|uniref:Gamma-interferon-inducible lysosomal thiol reductase-like n=1 Tax=Acanthaster planci TaxID=133434 RepID=A0A8B7ZVJ9_ACAPL|nr:gamma-interferon-inducible lysosomal thiol reductase-like [Acanthaster planci]
MMGYRSTVAVLLVVFATQSARGMSCTFPPELWCSSSEIAESCHVVKQCSEWQSPVKDAPKVNFTLYYESYCPDCQLFISGQLHDAYMAVSEIMNLTMVPYGNAEEKREGSKYVFQCQHGQEECRGNVLETCILHFAPFQTAFQTIYCMEVSRDPVTYARECMEKMKVNPEQVFACANGSLGNALEHQMALKTDALKPPHQYVPWVTLNGVHTEKIQNEAEMNLKKLICDTYQGAKKPPACSQDKPKLRSRMRE